MNPIRYRGYYYDNETGLYYLQSRYYDSAIGRFVNADTYISTGQGFIGYNMFAYCNNNPVDGIDPCGDINWGKLFSGATLIGIGLAACAVAATVVTGGASAPLIALAGLTFAAGGMSVLNGTAEVIESATDYNYMREGIYGGNSQAYEQQKTVFAKTAEIGTTALTIASGAKAVGNAISTGKLEIGNIKGVRASDGYPGIRYKTDAGPAYSIELHGFHNEHTPHLQINKWIYGMRRYEGQPYRHRSWHFEFFKPWKGIF